MRPNYLDSFQGLPAEGYLSNFRSDCDPSEFKVIMLADWLKDYELCERVKSNYEKFVEKRAPSDSYFKDYYEINCLKNLGKACADFFEQASNICMSYYVDKEFPTRKFYDAVCNIDLYDFMKACGADTPADMFTYIITWVYEHRVERDERFWTTFTGQWIYNWLCPDQRAAALLYVLGLVRFDRPGQKY